MRNVAINNRISIILIILYILDNLLCFCIKYDE
jgi:hypothetical protein